MEKEIKIGVYGGSFDPFTEGHGDIVDASINIFDQVIIAIARNSAKTPFFTVESRKEAIEHLYKEMPMVKVIVTEGFVSDTARFYGATLIRGIRDGSEAGEEVRLARINKEISDVQTIILVSNPIESFTSSSLVRELIKHGKIEQAKGFLEYDITKLKRV